MDIPQRIYKIILHQDKDYPLLNRLYFQRDPAIAVHLIQFRKIGRGRISTLLFFSLSYSVNRTVVSLEEKYEVYYRYRLQNNLSPSLSEWIAICIQDE